MANLRAKYFIGRNGCELDRDLIDRLNSWHRKIYVYCDFLNSQGGFDFEKSVYYRFGMIMVKINSFQDGILEMEVKWATSLKQIDLNHDFFRITVEKDTAYKMRLEVDEKIYYKNLMEI